MDFRGLEASAAARPTSSVPPKAKAATTKTEQKPLKPLLNAPGSSGDCSVSENICVEFAYASILLRGILGRQFHRNQLLCRG